MSTNIFDVSSSLCDSLKNLSQSLGTFLVTMNYMPVRKKLKPYEQITKECYESLIAKGYPVAVSKLNDGTPLRNIPKIPDTYGYLYLSTELVTTRTKSRLPLMGVFRKGFTNAAKPVLIEVDGKYYYNPNYVTIPYTIKYLWEKSELRDVISKLCKVDNAKSDDSVETFLKSLNKKNIDSWGRLSQDIPQIGVYNYKNILLDGLLYSCNEGFDRLFSDLKEMDDTITEESAHELFNYLNTYMYYCAIELNNYYVSNSHASINYSDLSMCYNKEAVLLYYAFDLPIGLNSYCNTTFKYALDSSTSIEECRLIDTVMHLPETVDTINYYCSSNNDVKGLLETIDVELLHKTSEQPYDDYALFQHDSGIKRTVSGGRSNDVRYNAYYMMRCDATILTQVDITNDERPYNKEIYSYNTVAPYLLYDLYSTYCELTSTTAVITNPRKWNYSEISNEYVLTKYKLPIVTDTDDNTDNEDNAESIDDNDSIVDDDSFDDEEIIEEVEQESIEYSVSQKYVLPVFNINTAMMYSSFNAETSVFNYLYGTVNSDWSKDEAYKPLVESVYKRYLPYSESSFINNMSLIIQMHLSLLRDLTS